MEKNFIAKTMKPNRYIFSFILVLVTIINTTFVDAQTRPPLKRKLNVIARKIEFAREVQLSLRDQSTLPLIQTAESKLRQAQNLMQNRRVLLANRMMNEAEAAANEALAKLLQEPLKNRNKKLQQQIEEAHIIVRDSQAPHAIDLLDQGIENKKLAEQAFRGGNFQLAIRHFKKAERQVQNAMDSVKNKDKLLPEKARDEADQFRQLLERTTPIAKNSSNPMIQRNYRAAIKLSQDARQAESGGNYRLSIEYHRQAMQLLRRTIDLAEGKADREALRAYEEIDAMDELIEKIQQKITPMLDEERIQFYLTHLEQIQQDAHAALDEKNYKLALLNTGYARDIIEQLHKKIRSATDADAIQESITPEVDELELDLDELHERIKNEGSHSEAEMLLMYAVLAKNRASELIRMQRYRFARESLFLAKRFANATDRLLSRQSVTSVASDSIYQKIQDVGARLKNLTDDTGLASNADLQIHFDHAKKILDFANQNFSKGYYYVANECIEACEAIIERVSRNVR